MNSISKANLHSLSSQLDRDDNLWGTDETSFTSKGLVSLGITSSINSSPASSARRETEVFCRSSKLPGSCLTAASRHLCCSFFQLIPSLSPHHTWLKSQSGVSPPILFCALGPTTNKNCADSWQYIAVCIGSYG